MNLRPYQQKAIASIGKIFTSGKKRAVLYSPTGCLAGDTIIECNRAGKSFKIKISDLVSRFNGERITWGKKQNAIKGKGMFWDNTIPTMVRSMSSDGFIRLFRLDGAVNSGMKSTYRVTTETDHSIRATSDHQFHTQDGWKRLSDLTVNDFLFVEGKAERKEKKKPCYKLISGLKNHPYAGRKGVKSGKGGYSVPLHRLVMESYMNNESVSDWISHIRHNRIHEDLIFLNPEIFLVHHKDENTTNNDILNLEIIGRKEHSKLHGENGSWKHVTAYTVPSKIVSIEFIGQEQTYDLTLLDEPRNFMANSIVVHNSGKTEIGMEIIRRALALNRKVIFICNRIELVIQTSRRISADEIPHGIIQGSNTSMNWEPVQICSIQTIDKRGYPEADVVIIDEAHGTAGSKAYRKFMEHYKDKFILGLTATPFARGMAKEYPWGTMWEDIASAATIRELIDQKYLVDCDIYAPGEPDLSKVKIVAGDYHEKELGEAVDKPKLIGDIVLHWKKLGNEKSTVCFATNIAHSKHIVEQFKSIGVAAEHMDCYSCDEDRKNILARVRSGETKIISNVGILAEGWDFPECEVMILARPTRSLIRYIQMCGRILRPFAGKEKATILDHSGTCVRLGFPTDDLPLFLDDGKPRDNEKKKKEEQEKKEKLPVICPSCSMVVACGFNVVCPRCGHEFPKKKNTVESIEGELKLVKRNGKKIIDMPTAERAIVYSELLGYAREKGYKAGWAWWKCKELFGNAPREKMSASKPSEKTLKLIRYLNIKQAKARTGHENHPSRNSNVF